MGEKPADIFSLYDERKKKYKTIIYKHINSAAPSRQKMIVCIVGELITEQRQKINSLTIWIYKQKVLISLNSEEDYNFLSNAQYICWVATPDGSVEGHVHVCVKIRTGQHAMLWT